MLFPSATVLLAERRQVVLPSHVAQVGVGDDEIRGEHRGGDLGAVVAATHERFAIAFTLGRLADVGRGRSGWDRNMGEKRGKSGGATHEIEPNRSAKAGSRRFAVIGEPVLRET